MRKQFIYLLLSMLLAGGCVKKLIINMGDDKPAKEKVEQDIHEAKAQIKEAKDMFVSKDAGSSDEYPEEIKEAALNISRAEIEFELGNTEESQKEINRAMHSIGAFRTKTIRANRVWSDEQAESARDDIAAEGLKHYPELSTGDFRTYTVRDWRIHKDCLWNISDRIYGDPWKWTDIYLENKEQIDNPDLIYPGQELRIPE